MFERIFWKKGIRTGKIGKYYGESDILLYQIQEVNREWNVFKEIFKYYSDQYKISDQLYNSIMDHQMDFTNLMPLIEFYFSIQSNSAECERRFSKMNNTKTKK